MDTGADISLCKKDVLHINENIDDNNYCKLSGISNESLNSLCSINMQLGIFDKIISHKIQIVDSNFPIKTDGIIGRDILNKLLAKIDYETFTVTFIIDNEELTIPMKTKIFNDFFIQVPKRSEAIHEINILLNEDSLVLNKQLQEGVFLSNCIIPKEGTKYSILLMKI